MSAAPQHLLGREPPEPPPFFGNITPTSIIEESKSIIAKSAALRDHLASTLTPSTATFANLIRPLVDDSNTADCRVYFLCYLLARVSADPETREASREAQKLVKAAETTNLLRSDIAGLVAAVVEKSKTDEGNALDTEDRYLLEQMYGQYRRSGAEIEDEAGRARLEEIKREVNDILAAAQKVFTETSDGLWFTRSELEGTPENWQESLEVEPRGERKEDRLWVTFRDDHYVHVLRSASSEETRRRMCCANQERFPENVGRLSRLLVLRDEMARLLGYENHAALKVEERMVRTVSALEAKLRELRERILPLAQAETAELMALKKKDNIGDYNVKFYQWDSLYYGNIHQRESYSVDNVRVMEYFEAAHTAKGMLRIFEKLFGLRFGEIPGASVWHESVRAYSAWDSDEEGGAFLGYLYLDLYARPGKYKEQYHMGFKPVSSSRQFHFLSLLMLQIVVHVHVFLN
jgi:metallopeptidase MepB